MNDEQELMASYAASDVRATGDFFRSLREGLMGADGYRPDHYHGYDTSRLGGTMGDTVKRATDFIQTINDVVAVHVFSDKIIVVDGDGLVSTHRLA